MRRPLLVVIAALLVAVYGTPGLGPAPQDAAAIDGPAIEVFLTLPGIGAVTIVDGATNSVAATIDVGGWPAGIVLSPDGSVAYVANNTQGVIHVIDAETRSLEGSFAIGDRPFGLEIAPDGSELYVTRAGPYGVDVPGSVAVVDLATMQITHTIEVGYYPHTPAVSPDGSRLYVPNVGPCCSDWASTTVSVIDLDLYEVIGTPVVGSKPTAAAVTLDGGQVYVALHGTDSPGVAVLNADDLSVGASIPLPVRSWGISLNPAGTLVFAGLNNCCGFGPSSVSVIAVGSNSVIGSIPVGRTPNEIGFSPDGDRVYIGNGEDPTLTVADANTFAVIETVALPSFSFMLDVRTDVGSNNHDPNADAGGPYAVAESGTVVLDGDESADPDADDELTFAWDLDGDDIFGETGVDAANGDETGTSPTFSAAALDGPTDITVTLRVTDQDGATDEATATVAVDNADPTIADVTNDGPIDAGGTASIAVTASDPAGLLDPLAYAFDCDDDGTFEVGPQAEATAACLFAQPGEYVVHVTVTDDDGGSATGSTTVTANNTPPAVVLPGDVQVEGNTLGGANVTYDVSATDAQDGALPVACDPASSAFFPLGSTEVVCSVTDSGGLTIEGSFVITVVDTTAPTVAVPATIVVEATSPDGAEVAFDPEPSAVDTVAGPVDVTCTAVSGATFPIGETVVECAAVDPQGNVGAASFSVVVQATLSPPDKESCKNGGWRQFNDPFFANQGECVQYVETSS